MADLAGMRAQKLRILAPADAAGKACDRARLRVTNGARHTRAATGMFVSLRACG